MKAIAYINGTYVRKLDRCGHAYEFNMDGKKWLMSSHTDDKPITVMQSIGAKLMAAKYVIQRAVVLGAKELTIINNLNFIEDLTFGYCEPQQEGTINYVDTVRPLLDKVKVTIRRPETKEEEKKLKELVFEARKALNS